MNNYDPNSTDPLAWPNTIRPGDPVPPDSVVGNSPLWQNQQRQPAGQPSEPPKKHSTRNIVLASLMVLVGIGVAASLSQQPSAEAPVSVTSTAGVDNGPTPDPAMTPTNEPSAAKPAPKTTPPKVTSKPAPKLTMSQEQAIGSAQDYLHGQFFSRKGLIDQLGFEGFSVKDATFGVDYLQVDWKAQAVGSAKGYLRTQHFSRSGLIQQLEYEGFTHTQAKYGVTKAGL